MPQPTPGHVGDVQQPIHPIEIDECSEVSDVFHHAGYAVAHVNAFHKFQAFFASLLLDYFAPAQHDVLAIVIELNDLKSYVLPTNCCKSFGGTTSICDARKNNSTPMFTISPPVPP